MTTWHDALAAWRNELQASGASNGTIRLYQHYLLRWSRACDRPDAATHDTLIEWLAVEHWRPETRKSARTALQSFYGWAHRTGQLPANPAVGLPTVRIPEPDPRPAADDDILDAMLSTNLTVRLMIQLGAISGLRRAEIARVHTRDLDRDDVLTVHGKGGRTRRIPLPPSMARAIRACLPGWVFPSPARPGRPLTPGCVGRWISATLPDGVTPHQLRHAAATSLHEDDGLSLLELRRFLGHANVGTTQRYVAVRSARLRAAALARARRLAS